MVKKIRKAVFPVAGMGTRFLPATKANPKEMLPVVDKPLIQYAAEEAEEAGVSSLVFVTGRNKRSIPDHFDKAYELESELKEAGKTALLEKVQNVLPEDVSCIYLRQSEALGLGHAVLCAEPVVADEPFAVILADDLIRGDGGVGALEQMAQIYERYQCSVILVEEVPQEETSKYGIVEVEDDDGETATITSIVEKPKPEDAPSNLGVVGRYILTPRIFSLIKETGRGAGGEIQLTDAIAELLKYEKVRAYRVKGKRYDCGSKLGYLEATVELGLAHEELGDGFKDYLKELAEKL
ncbi:MAG: UTP--glucose-1-phosphate uridylyltransferase [gamma proteobacterium symbiont of Stewartia floridana]|uniref:UTP--glucose-1-phosphate uridylyltransferase n=1 Tax=Candidatus Thiodiazotropha taylori TaxID=2792791 RepID=A0A9E4KA68_9GAMM|nr:UTP--glucose-1-phosphate uridylyltransferase GalU [Candidatus Thiodiazotropha taylori]MCG7962256.1 UTP--glucose-1-phosphate uridylyltransferase GalU [Candidatus Thiodiazotropha endolucinida]RLW54284.1 MAG: UTP--glucose-1-phosphate uridylyltransferase [gamma proteobacterium symbiont of Stewartia floridana]MCG7893422.1 UTP--glucose-1-phosphate uridylyltransferase GalU [Candidatus Thiodiazotropha taylori]MCG7910352.1 UTP--glucose-1-phosphate uridylyltransferase GalU [Candidatus Thiodiazotropha 